MVWTLLIGFGVFYCINMVLSFRQGKDLAHNYVELRRQGKVVIGKYKRLLNSGGIIMFGINDDHQITDTRLLTGVTVFSRFRQRPEFSGIPMDLVGCGDYSQEPKNVRMAIKNAADNYNKFIKGEEIDEPEGPWVRATRKFSRTREKTH